jgi:hypothetical protein
VNDGDNRKDCCRYVGKVRAVLHERLGVPHPLDDERLGLIVVEVRVWTMLTAEEGLRAVTIDAAWALGDEENRGHLAVGTYGGVTILSGDVTAAAPDEVRAMSVIATIVDGVVAHCGAPEVCQVP